MKKKILLPALALIGLSVAIVSCKKHKDDATTPTTPSSKTCTMSQAVSEDDSTVFTYDSQNRILKIENYLSDKSFEGSTKYDYTSGKIVVTHYDENNVAEDIIYYYVNSNGIATYSATTSDITTSGGVKGTSYDTTYYTYNTDGYNTVQVRKSTYLTSSSYDTTWNTFSDGNKIISTESGIDGDVTTYVYNSNEDKGYLDSDEMIPGLFGKESKNLISSYKNQDNSIHGSNTYEFNSDGYVSRYMPVAVTTFGTDSFDYHLSYNCK